MPKLRSPLIRTPNGGSRARNVDMCKNMAGGGGGPQSLTASPESVMYLAPILAGGGSTASSCEACQKKPCSCLWSLLKGHTQDFGLEPDSSLLLKA